MTLVHVPSLGARARNWEALNDVERMAISALVPERKPWKRVRLFNFYRAAKHRGARLLWTPARVYIRWPVRSWFSWFAWHGWELDPEHVEPEHTSWGKMPGYRERLGHCITLLKCIQVCFGPTILEVDR